MKLKYAQNLMPAQDGMQKIAAITWAPNGEKMAVATSEKIVYLYDDNGKYKDKFSTKASEKAQKSYVIKGLQFSPDSQKIAVAQSDNIVFIYKIGAVWGQKKLICNKYMQTSQVTCLTWPRNRPNQIFFGLAEGKVKMQSLKNKKAVVLYSTSSFVVSIASSRDSDLIVSAHVDASIYLYNINTQSSKKVLTHHSVPYALGLGENLVAAGNDNKVSFYDLQGNIISRFDYTSDEKVKDFTVAAFNPAGDTVAIGNFNRFFVYNYSHKIGSWEQTMYKQIPNYYSVTAAAWRSDGSKLIIGSLCGSLDIYDASLRNIRLRGGKFIVNYVSPSQLVLQTMASGKKLAIRSGNGAQISKVDVMKQRYFVGSTYSTVILADLQSNKVSQISWKGSGQEKYIFSNPGVCMIYNAGELTLVEYGINQIVGTCRTQYIKDSMISVRANQKKGRVIAYLLDMMTICVQDLNSGSTISQISHDTKIDYLQLNARGNKLLFKDKRKQLYLYNLATLSKSTLLPFCSFVQWVPNSEVVVAQNRGNLCVWYSIENPDKVTIYQIKGDADSIERKAGKTEVVVSDGVTTNSYSLDESLIQFGFAVQAKDLQKAAAILDTAELSPQTESNWKSLATIAVQTQNLSVAQHCYSALGDISKASYMRKINKIIRKYKQETGSNEGIKYYKVQAMIALLEKQFAKAEAILLQHNQVENAMEMYQELHKWDDSIRIAEKKNHPDVADLKSNYFQWLIDTGQQQAAAQVKQKQGNYTQAVKLYLKGNLPARAAQVVMNYNQEFTEDLLEKIAASLAASGLNQKAGQFYQEMGHYQKSLQCYCRGNSYKKAVELARRLDPQLVTSLQDRWGDYLVSVKQTESAINHYIQAGSIKKAIQAAIQSREWNKAIQLLANQKAQVSRPYYSKIATYYASVRQYDFAQKYFLEARLPIQAFQMYAKVSKWDQALRIAKEYLPQDQQQNLYLKQGAKFESQGKLKEAQKMYLTVEEVDSAIAMYKKAEQWDNMLRLVAKFRPKFIKETHLAIAAKNQEKGNLKEAQQHFIQGGAWHGAVNMHRQKGNWQDAIRCCKMYGNDKQTCQLAKKWLEHLGPEQGMKMLMKMNLVDAVVEHLCDKKEFQQAFRIANNHAKHKIRDAHLKYAFFLQDQNRFKEAEEHFVKSGKPDEAINMYQNIKDHHSAIQVAKEHMPNMLPSIYLNQARFFIEKRDFTKAQNCFINAKKPELAIKMYRDAGMKSQANRLYKKFPHIPQLPGQDQTDDPADLIEQAKAYDTSRNFLKALDCYLQIKAQNFGNQINEVVDCWERAIQIAFQYQKDRLVETTRIIAKRLANIGRHQQAGSHMQNIGFYQDAVKLYLQGKLIERAEQCCEQVRNKESYQQLKKLINDKKRNKAIQQKNTDNLVVMGDIDNALKMMVSNNDWENCLIVAQKNGAQYLNKYLTIFVKQCYEANKFGEAAQAYSKFGMPLIPQSYGLYKNLCIQILVECDPKQITYLRTALFNFVKLLEGTTDGSSPVLKQFDKFLTITHIANMRFIYQQKGAALAPLQAKTSISLLKHSQFIRLDKVYFDAGTACQKVNQLPMAIKFLNRYLDINDLIDDPNNNNLADHEDFASSDIPNPEDVPFPQKNMISNEERDKIKDWLLQIAMTKKVDSTLPHRNCDKCGTPIFEGSITCYKCKTRNESCVLTGYPLLASNTVKCRSCGKGGLRQAWSLYLQHFANCAWCGGTPN